MRGHKPAEWHDDGDQHGFFADAGSSLVQAELTMLPRHSKVIQRLQAEKIGLDSMDVEALKKMNKSKNPVKKYHAFLASHAIFKQTPCLLGPGPKRQVARSILLCSLLPCRSRLRGSGCDDAEGCSKKTLFCHHPGVPWLRWARRTPLVFTAAVAIVRHRGNLTPALLVSYGCCIQMVMCVHHVLAQCEEYCRDEFVCALVPQLLRVLC